MAFPPRPTLGPQSITEQPGPAAHSHLLPPRALCPHGCCPGPHPVPRSDHPLRPARARGPGGRPHEPSIDTSSQGTRRSGAGAQGAGSPLPRGANRNHGDAFPLRCSGRTVSRQRASSLVGLAAQGITARLLGAAAGAGAVRGSCPEHLVFWGAAVHRGPDDFIQGEPASLCGGPRTLVPLSGVVLGGSDALPVFSSCGFCPPSLPLLPDTSLLP